jgi:hypothetical protein
MTDERDVELETDNAIEQEGAEQEVEVSSKGKDTEPKGEKLSSLREALKASVEKLRQPEDEEKPVATKPKAKEAPKAKTEAEAGRASPDAEAPSGKLEAPKGWTKEAKDAWGTLPPHVQAAVSKRETDIAEGIKKIQERYGPVHAAVTSAADMMQKYQQTPASFVERVVEWAKAIDRNPAGAITELAKQYKIDLTKLGSPTQANMAATTQQNGTAQPAAHDPRIDGLLSKVQSFEAAEQARQQSATTEVLKSWAKDKPHFEKVRPAMSQIVAGAMQMQDSSILDANGRIDLDKVYDQAVFMVPEVREEILKEQRKAQQDATREAAKKAKRAGVSAKPSAPPSRSEVKQSLRDTVRAAMEEVRNR